MDELMQAVEGVLAAPPPVEAGEEAPPASMVENLKEYARLANELRRVDAETEALKVQARAVEARLLDQFADSGCKSARVGDLTLYVRMDRYVSKRGEVDTDRVCRALRACGLGYMVSDGYNASSLKSKIKEYQDEGVEVPGELAELLNIGEVPRLATRKAN